MIELMLKMLEITRPENVQDIEIAILIGMYKLPRTYEDGKEQIAFKKLYNRLLTREKALLKVQEDGS